MKVAPPRNSLRTCSLCVSEEILVSVIGYILGSCRRTVNVMNDMKQSPDEVKHDDQDEPAPTERVRDQRSPYYYDDSTNYEIYGGDEDDNDAEPDSGNQSPAGRSCRSAS